MAHEKLYTAKQAAEAVLKKTEELLAKSAFMKAETGHEKGVHTNIKPLEGVESKHEVRGVSAGRPFAGHGPRGAKEEHKSILAEMKAMPKPNLPKSEDMGKSEDHGEKCTNCSKPATAWSTLHRGKGHGTEEKTHFTCGDKACNDKMLDATSHPKRNSTTGISMATFKKSEDLSKAEPKGEIHPKEKEQAPPDSIRGQAAPEKNPKEQAEGNNELAGTTPTQVGQDGKNKPGFDEMMGHLKLAKFIGHMESKRKSKAALPEMGKAETGHEKGIHTATGQDSGAKAADRGKGKSRAGNAARNTQLSAKLGFATGVAEESKKATKGHRAVLETMKAMPKPKLPG